MSKKKIVTVIFLILSVIVLFNAKTLLEKRKKAIAEQTTPKEHILNVSLVQAKAGILEEKVSFLATIFSKQSITLSTKLVAYVEKVHVKEAQYVKKGDLLVELDSYEIRSSIQALKATLIAQADDILLAQQNYERNVKLYKIGGLSQESLHASEVALKLKKAAYKNTQEKIQQLQHQRSYLSIKAPFDALIDAVILHKGDLAVANKPIIKMSQKAQKLLFSYAPHKYHNIQKGKVVLLDDTQIGVVSAVYPSATNGLRTAEVALNQELSLPIESSLNIEVLIEKKEGWIVPSTTILHKKDGNYVMVYEDKKFHPKKVTILLENKNQVLLAASPKAPLANASEVKLALLSSYGDVVIAAKE